MANRPISSVGPNRCLTTRSIRSAWCRSPVNSATVSTTCSRVLGPAREPSLVRWPTSTVARDRALASTTRRWADARTWPTEPGAPPSAARCTVWTESTMSRSGRSSSRWATMASTEASPASHRSSWTAPRRSARRRTWAADSSALTSSTRPPARTRAAANCRVRVDLPTPGSPPSRVTDPGTSPPPRARSASAIPVGAAADSSAASADMGRASPTSNPAGGTAPAPPPGPDRTTGTSTRAFQSPQVPHRPTQLGWGAPQEAHSKVVRGRGPAVRLVMATNLRTACDRPGRAQPGRARNRPAKPSITGWANPSGTSALPRSSTVDIPRLRAASRVTGSESMSSMSA